MRHSVRVEMLLTTEPRINRKLSKHPRHLFNRGRSILLIIDLPSTLILPFITFPFVPVANPDGSMGFSDDLVTIFCSKVLDCSRLAIDLGVKVCNLLTSRPKRHDRMLGILDRFRIRSRKLGKALREMIDGTGVSSIFQQL